MVGLVSWIDLFCVFVCILFYVQVCLCYICWLINMYYICQFVCVFIIFVCLCYICWFVCLFVSVLYLLVCLYCICFFVCLLVCYIWWFVCIVFVGLFVCRKYLECMGCYCMYEQEMYFVVVVKLGIVVVDVGLEDLEIDVFVFNGCCKCVNDGF